MSFLSACKASSFFNHLLSFIWCEFSKTCSIRFLPIDIHGVGIMVGRALEGGGEALLLSLSVVIGKVKLGGITDPSFEGERSGDDTPTLVKERTVKAVLIELNEGWIPYYSSFQCESFEFSSVFITGLGSLLQLV